MSHARFVVVVCIGVVVACQAEGPATQGGETGSGAGGLGGRAEAMAGSGGDQNEGGTPGAMMPAGGGNGTGGAGTSTAAGGSGAVMPEGSVPMFVAIGRGGRRIMSCDKGRTWVANQFISTVDGEHSTFTPKGLAYGDGTFVFLSGWGNPSTTWISRNGIDWLEQKHQVGFAGLGFDNGRFVLVGQNYHEGSNDKGATLSKLTTTKASLGREGAAFDGIWAAGSDGQAQIMRKSHASWMALSGCSGQRHGGIGADGGFAAGNGVMISVGNNGDVCGVNIESGSPLVASKLNASVRGKPAFVGDGFMVATGDKVHLSPNGTTWTATTLPQGTTIDLVARDSSGTFVGLSLDGDNFFYSDDGLRWTKGAAPAGNGMVAVVAGAGVPSTLCKLP